MRVWKITYLPYSEHRIEKEWVFRGSEFELDEYLQKNHGCGCPDCADMYWWHSAEACEYLVEEITEYKET